MEGVEWGGEDPLHTGGGEAEGAPPQGVPRLQVPSQEAPQVRRGGGQGGRQEGGQGPEDHQDQLQDQAGAGGVHDVGGDAAGRRVESALQPAGVSPADALLLSGEWGESAAGQSGEFPPVRRRFGADRVQVRVASRGGAVQPTAQQEFSQCEFYNI